MSLLCCCRLLPGSQKHFVLNSTLLKILLPLINHIQILLPNYRKVCTVFIKVLIALLAVRSGTNGWKSHEEKKRCALLTNWKKCSYSLMASLSLAEHQTRFQILLVALKHLPFPAWFFTEASVWTQMISLATAFITNLRLLCSGGKNGKPNVVSGKLLFMPPRPKVAFEQ